MSDAAPEPALRLTRLTLSDFRNYQALTWRPASRITAIFGANGSGKTNLLEAISLLVPGRGLRGARPTEFLRRGAEGGRWGVAARFTGPAGEVDIGTGTPPDGPPDRRIFRLDGAPPRNQGEIALRVAAVWLTPQMDRLFQEAASGRRRFLDRLVWALEPSHAREVAAHDTAVASRNRLLAQGHVDPAWLAGVEDQVARHAVAVAAARVSLVAALNRAAASDAGAFPAARMALLCPVAERLAQEAALATEDWLRGALRDSRMRDAAVGSTGLGAHRADMSLQDAASDLPAALASTGQQKALLIGVILGHAALLARQRGYAPLLLLDEPLVHLDEERRALLFAALRLLPAQAILTGTDRLAFQPLADLADEFETAGGALHGRKTGQGSALDPPEPAALDRIS